MQRAAMLDRPLHRLPFVALAALTVWCGLLIVFGLYLEPRSVSQPLEMVQASIIEGPLDGFAGGAAAASGVGPLAAKPALPRAAVHAAPAPKPRPLHHSPRHVEFRSVTAPAVARPHELKKMAARPITQASVSSSQRPPASAPALGKAQGKDPMQAPAGGGGKSTGAGSGTGSGNGSAGGSSAGGGAALRTIYAPVPSIPEDMRDDVLQATAVARFRVSREGKATVALIRPTEFSRLNEIILETLREWRFQPAIKGGVAVDSEADVRLLITVQ